MSGSRPTVPGSTRTCPHCRAAILESAAVCPACRHHLRFDPAAGINRPAPSFSALKVEGTIRHPVAEDPWEYSVLVTVRNERGEEVTRQVIGVGALTASQLRTFSLSVEVFPGVRSKLTTTVNAVR